MSMYSDGGNNRVEKLLKESELDRLTSEVSKRLENITNYTEDLQEFEEKLGSNSDTKSFRAKMREKIDQTQKEIKSTLDVLAGIDNLELKTKNEQENRNKMSKRFKDAFTKEKDKYTAILKQINAKEKVHIDLARRSTIKAEGTSSFANGDDPNSYSKADEMQIQEINYNEEVINDREEDVQKVKEAVNLMNEISKQQAMEIHKQGEDLEIVVDNIGSTKDNVQKANKQLETAYKYEKSSSRKNLYICLIVMIIAAVVVVVALYG